MDFTPLFDAPWPVKIHVFGVVLAIILGPSAFLRRRRDIWHKILGYGWVTAMLITALSSFFISHNPIVGPFGPIHILSVLALVGVLKGVQLARTGNVRRHGAQMQSLYFWALGIAGIFAFLPDRRMNQIFFGGESWLGFFIAACVILGLMQLGYRSFKREHDEGLSARQ